LYLQCKGFNCIFFPLVDREPRPVILVDTASAIQDKKEHSVHSYSLVGWSRGRLTKDHLFLLDDTMNIRWRELDNFLGRHKGEKIILFGLTFMIWQYLYRPLVKRECHLELNNSMIFHVGGWKRLEKQKVDNRTFKMKLKEQLGVNKVHNYYSTTEAAATIFLECEEGYFHAPDFADIIIRDMRSLHPLPHGKRGLIQLLSVIPRSFPGHSLLTEDVGSIVGEDDCLCGRKGKYFEVKGRMPWAELRGCSDTYLHDCCRGEIR